MKRLLTILIVLMVLTVVSAQECNIPVAMKITDNSGKLNTDDSDRIASVLRQTMIDNGFSGAEEASRFVLAASVSQTDMETVGGIRPSVIVTLDINLYLANVITGEQLSAETITISGAGISESTAYRKALKGLKSSNKSLNNFMVNADHAVLDYYNKQLPNLLNDVDGLSIKRDFAKAMWILSSIPPCINDYDKVLGKMNDVFDQSLSLDCSQKLQTARAAWAATQNIDGAQAALTILASIDPEASCSTEVDSLLKEIADTVKTIKADDAMAEQRLLDFYKEMQRAENDNERARIEAMRAIGKAYGDNQQQQNVIFN